MVSLSMCPPSVSGGQRGSATRDPATLIRSELLYVRIAKTKNGEHRVHIVAGVDLGGTAVNYTLVDGEEEVFD